MILPTIITEPGDYVTRCGETVTITDIQMVYGTVPQFGHGYYHDEDKTKETWDISGRVLPFSLSDNDIMYKKVEDVSNEGMGVNPHTSS